MPDDRQLLQQDGFAVYANVVDGRGKLRDGAKVLVRYSPGGDDTRMMVAGLSVGGRRIEIWEAASNLTRPRIQTVPPEHPDHGAWGTVLDRERCAYIVKRIEAANG